MVEFTRQELEDAERCRELCCEECRAREECCDGNGLMGAIEKLAKQLIATMDRVAELEKTVDDGNRFIYNTIKGRVKRIEKAASAKAKLDAESINKSNTL